MVTVYEQPILRAALGDELHPGGLALTDEMLAAAALPVGAFVADVGCGAGLTANHLHRRYRLRVVGIDLSAVLLGDARRTAPDLPLILADARRLPFADGTLDAVLVECVLAVLPDPDAALAEVGRVLKPGGRLFASDTYRRDESGTLAEALRVHGLTLEQWRDRSDALKVFAARLIFAGIPLSALGCWCSAATGYCWYIARKT